MAYGRNVTASKGPRIQYNVGAKTAESFLEPGESSQYQAALGTMGADRPQFRAAFDTNRRYLTADNRKRMAAEKEASQLRNVAATRALGEFSKAGMQTSKPWLRTASEGLISEQSVTAPFDVDRIYEGQGGRKMNLKQKKKIGDIAKYADFKFGAIGVPGQPVRSNAGPVGATTSPGIADPAQPGTTAQPIDLGNGDTGSGNALQDLIDQIHAGNLAGLGG